MKTFVMLIELTEDEDLANRLRIVLKQLGIKNIEIMEVNEK